MTQKVPSSVSQMVNKLGKLVPPWNSYFQSLSQNAPAAAPSTVTTSPFTITPNTNGTLVVQGGAITNLSLIRGNVTFNLTGEQLIPISIGDSVSVTFTVAPTINFLGA